MRSLLRRPTLHFLVLGLLLLIADRKFNAELPQIVVESARLDAVREQWQRQLPGGLDDKAMTALLNQQIDDEILFREGMDRGLNYSPVVRRRLIQLGQFLKLEGEGLTDEELIDKVRAMGLEESDTLVRRYLVMAVEQLLANEVRVPQPTEAEIDAWYQANLPEYVEPGRRKLSHVYVGGLDEAARQRAADITSLLQAEPMPLDAAIREGDVFYGGHHLPMKTRQQMDNTLGAKFSEAIWPQPAEQWFGPVESAYGWHAVWIEARVDDRQKPVAEVSDTITRALVDKAVKAGVNALLEEKRKDYRIIVPPEYLQWFEEGAS